MGFNEDGTVLRADLDAVLRQMVRSKVYQDSGAVNCIKDAMKVELVGSSQQPQAAMPLRPFFVSHMR